MSATRTAAMRMVRGRTTRRHRPCVQRRPTPSCGRRSARDRCAPARTACRPCAFSMPAAAPAPGSGELPFMRIVQGLGVDAVGFDISTGQLDIARQRAETLARRLADVRSRSLEFREYSLSDPLPWATGQLPHRLVQLRRFEPPAKSCAADRHRRIVPGRKSPGHCDAACSGKSAHGLHRRHRPGARASRGLRPRPACARAEGWNEARAHIQSL